jgi:SAM-dependent methyltransferase
VYSLLHYGSMIGDRARTEAYAEALRRTVRPGSAVLDIGTGAGILALLACRAGARKVYAIEPSPVVHLAEQLAAANECADRIVCIRNISTRIALPEPVDVVVSEVHGLLPPFGASLVSLIDAHRFLAPGGTMIPRQEAISAAVVEDASAYRPYVDNWNGDPYGVDLAIGRTMVLNSVSKMRVEMSDLLTPPVRICVFDYLTLEDPDVAAEFTSIATRSGTAHGIVAWFDSVLADGVTLSNAPGQPPLIFGQMFFPWQSPVAIDAGDRVDVTLHAKFIESDYVWAWNSRVTNPSGTVTATFRQSTFLSVPISLDQLRRESPERVPEASTAVRMAQFVLGCVDGRTPASEIAARVAAQFPDQFGVDRQPLAYVQSVLDAG